MKRISALILSLVLVCGLAACGGSSTSQTPSSTPENASADAPQGSDENSGTLVVYSTQTAEITNYFTEQFQKETGITVEVVAGGGSEIIKRVEAEQANPLGDIVWSIGTESMDAQKHLFQPYESPELAHFNPGFVDSEYRWTCDFVMPFVIIYNKDMISEDQLPEGWADLVNPAYKGQIAFADPMKSGSSYTQVATFISVFGKGDEAWDFMKEFIINLDDKLLQGSTDVPKRVSDGEYMLGLTSETFANEFIRAGANIGIIYPKEGTVPYSTALGIIDGAPNAENAQKFMDYMLSQAVEQDMTNKFYKRSVRDDVTSPEGLAEMESINFIDYDLSWAAQEKENIMNRWKDMIVGIY